MKSAHTSAYIKDNAIVILGTFIAYFKAIILMPLIIKTMGVTIYGGYVLFISLVGIIFGISSFGVGVRAKRYLPSCKTMDARRKLFYPQMVFGFCSILFFSLLLYFFNDQIYLYLFKNEFIYSAFIFPVYMVSYFLYSQGLDYLRFTSRTRYMTLANVIFPYVTIGIIMLVLFGRGYISINALVLSEAVSASLLGIICFTIILSEIGPKISLYSPRELWAEIRLGTPLMFNVIIDFILSASDRYLISIFLSVSAVGFYNPAYLLGSLVMIIPKAMSTAVPQLMSKAIDSNDQNLAELMVDYTIKIFLMLAIPFVFGSLVLSREILVFLANAEVANMSSIVTPVVATGIIFYGLTYIMSNILFVQLKTDMMLKVNILAAAINFGANVILLYFFRDIMVAALTTLLSYFISFIYLNNKLRASWNINYDQKFIVKVILSSGLMTVAATMLAIPLENLHSILRLVILITTSIIVYVTSLVLLKTFSRREIDIFIKNARSHPSSGGKKSGRTINQ